MNRLEPTIIYFGNDWFAENRTSSHHVARELARRHRVIYVECPGLRAPQGSRRDFHKIGRLFLALWRFVRGGTKVDDNVTVVTLPQIPLHRFRVVRAVNHALSRVALRSFMFCHRIRRPVAWFIAPHVAHLCGTLGEALSVYYCVDDFAAFPGMDADSIQKMDDELTRRADLVFVASDTLLERKRLLNAQVTHSPHGVDVDHFSKAARGEAALPAEIASLKKPVVGFFGLIENWIDLDLVAHLARNRPQYSFVMIGRVAVPESTLPRLPNLHFLGRRPYESLPDYGSGFDCCLIPYRLTRQVMHANPLKLREYLAMGKPVIAVSTPEIDQFADVVSIARSPGEFLDKLDEAVKNADTPAESARRLARVAPQSWEACVSRAWQRVTSAIEARRRNQPVETPLVSVLSGRDQ
jgi:glycosyltransferase involved in cell wall biosynthesis